MCRLDMIDYNELQAALNNGLTWMMDAGIMQKMLKDSSRAGQVPRQQREEGIQALSMLRYTVLAIN